MFSKEVHDRFIASVVTRMIKLKCIMLCRKYNMEYMHYYIIQYYATVSYYRVKKLSMRDVSGTLYCTWFAGIGELLSMSMMSVLAVLEIEWTNHLHVSECYWCSHFLLQNDPFSFPLTRKWARSCTRLFPCVFVLFTFAVNGTSNLIRLKQGAEMGRGPWQRPQTRRIMSL